MNNLFGDIWLVDTWQPEDPKEPDDPPYCLVLYCNRDECVIPIDEPKDFYIILRKNEPGYQEKYNECLESSRRNMAEWMGQDKKHLPDPNPHPGSNQISDKGVTKQ